MKPKDHISSYCEEESQPPPQVKGLAKKGSFFMPELGLFSFYPFYYEKSLTKKQQSYYHSNGHLLLLKSLQIKIVSLLETCRQLWKEFSPYHCLFDTWDFRLAFWKGYRYQPYFLVLKTERENLALLPLWYETDKKQYFWFGSWWQEENKFFVKDPLFIPLLLAVCPSPTLLNAISTELPLWLKQIINFEQDEPKYTLALKKFNSLDDYLATFKKKKRYNLKRDRRIIEDQGPKVVFDRFSDFKTLVALSKTRFAQKKEETDWEDPRRVETFRQVIKQGQSGSSYKIRMLTVVIGAKIAAVDLIALYNDCYYPLKCGNDVKNFPGIGNYVNLLEIEDALNLGMEKMDFLEIGYGWKEKWFTAMPLLQYKK